MKKIYTLLIVLLVGSQLKAQIVAWEFAGNAGSELVVPPTSTDPNLAVSNISRGVIIATALANTYAATNWTLTNSLPDAIANNSYYQFNAKANSGYVASFSELNVNFRRSATGPTKFQWRYSLDGTNFTDLGPQITYTGTENGGLAQPSISMSTVPALQNISSAFTVTFRLYGFSATDAAGSFAFGRLKGNDIDFSGKLNPSVVVPIRLMSFAAANNGDITRLHWQVNCTSSFIKFEMQRAGTDANFRTIYSSTESQARCAQPFDINDNNTAQGINLYRLKMIDIDGRIAYSNTIQILNKKSDNQEIKVFPTIASSTATIIIPAEKNYTASILVIDNQGRQVTKLDAQLLKGTNNISLNTAEFAPGKYYVKVVGGSQNNNTAVLIKQ